MKKLAAACGALAFLAGVGSASAGSITYNLVYEFTAGNPQNLLTAVFADGPGANTVTLTLSMSGPSTSEFVSEWFFNFSGDSSTLSFLLGTNTTGSGSEPVVTQTPNCCHAGPDGLFDFQFAFDNAPPPERFQTGEMVVYTITGLGITAADFDQPSAPFGNADPGGLFTAAHVQGICVENTPGCEAPSAWVTIPEPGPALLFGLGSLLAGVAIRRRS